MINYQRVTLVGDDKVIHEKGNKNPDGETTPPMSSNQKLRFNEEDIKKLEAGIQSEGCKINKKNKVCMNHNCTVRTYEVTSKKWHWIASKKEYGYVSIKMKKYVCMRANCTSDQSSNPEFRKQLDKLGKSLAIY